MGNDGIGDFMRQIPVGLLIAPIAFFVLYIGLMIYIFQRAAARRRARNAGVNPSTALKTKQAAPPLGSFLSGQLPDQRSEKAQWGVPAALRSLPEPDLESLSSVPLLAAPDKSPMAVPARASADASADDNMLMVYDPPTGGLMDNTPRTENSADPVPVPINDPGDAVEVLRVWRDLGDGSLIVELAGRRYRSSGEIINPELARRLSALVRELGTMVNTAGASSTPAISSGSAMVPSPSSSIGGLRARVEAMNTLGAVSSPSEESTRAPGLLRTANRATMPKAATQEPQRAGIADAVEEYLQYKLANSPELRQRNIHIRPAMDGGVRIEVDSHSYEAVGDVVDPDVRDFLTGVLREWEARQ